MRQTGVEVLPPIRALDLGTDPECFAPGRDTGRLRSEVESWPGSSHAHSGSARAAKGRM